MKKIKIAFVIDTLHNKMGGTEKQLLEFLRRLDHQRFEPHLICLFESDWMNKSPLPCDTFIVGFRGFFKSNIFSVVKRLRKYIRDNNIGIVQTFFEEPIFLIYFATLGLSPMPIRLTSRRDLGMGSNHPWYQRIYDFMRPWIVRSFNGVVVNSLGVKEYIHKKDSVPYEKIKLIYNGVNRPESSKTKPALFEKQRADVWYVLAANFNPMKRQDVFLRSLSYLKKMKPNLNFKAILLGQGDGTGKEERELAQLTAELGLSHHVFFEGAVPNVVDYLHRSDIGVLCSDREGLPNSILEYMSNSLPVVTTAVGGTPELVNKSNGFCVKPGNPTLLAESLASLSTDPDLRERMGLASKKKIESDFSWDRIMEQYSDYYLGLLKNGHGPHPLLNGKTNIRIGGLRVERISETEFSGLQDEWNALLEKSSMKTPFLTWDWMYSWWESFKSGKTLCLLKVLHNDEWVGIAPFYFEDRKFPIPMRQIQICSSKDLQPDYLDLIVKRGLEREVCVAVMDYLRKSETSWTQMTFDNLLPSSVLSLYMDSNQNEFLKIERFSSVCLYLPIQGTMDEYLTSRFKKKKRYNLKRQKRILFEDKNIKPLRVKDRESIEKPLEEFFNLHEKRAHEKGIRSSIANELAKEFFLKFSERFRSHGQLHMEFLMDDGKPVSGVYLLDYGTRRYFVQSGVDPAWEKYSVGTVLLMEMIQNTFESGLKEFDFLKGDEGYKRTWTNKEKVEFRIDMYKKTLLGKISYGLRRVKTMMKKSPYGVK